MLYALSIIGCIVGYLVIGATCALLVGRFDEAPAGQRMETWRVLAWPVIALAIPVVLLLSASPWLVRAARRP